MGRGHDNCTTIRYLPANVPWVRRFMTNLALAEGLDPDKDLVPQDQSASFLRGGLFEDVELLSNYTRDHPNQTELIVQFTSGYVFSDMPPMPGYILWYNGTQNAKEYNQAAAMMRAINQQVAREKMQNNNVTFDVRQSDFPLVESRISRLDVVSANGGVYFYLVPMIVFFVVFTNVVQEKEANLRTGMRMMGLTFTAYWSSWMVQATFFVLCSTLVLMATSAACLFGVFLLTNQFVLFLMFFLYGMAIVNMAFFFAAFVDRVQTAQAIGYGVILVGFIFQSILTSGYGMFVDILYSNQIPAWVVFLRWVFIQYPPFNFAKIYSDVVSLSGNYYNAGQGMIIQGNGFYWNNLTMVRTINLGGLGVFDVPPPYQALLFLIYNFAVWGVLAWYANMISGEGALPANFLFTQSFWGIDRLRQRLEWRDLAEPVVSDDGLGQENAGNVGADGVLVRVQNLCKEFYSNECCCCHPSHHKAVDKVSFEIRKGEIFGLLGHNGAGKSTTINMLTGLVIPSSGTMSIAGLDVQQSLADVRRLLGVCPQHDILFDNLTALEHLVLYAQLKGMTYEEAVVEAHEKLELVGLENVADHRVSTFSGGMKRRVSVSISAIGDPALMLLDEPSTGLDPVNQKMMWKLIQRLKNDRSILLTTHSMREAEVLSDRVAIIAFGRICAAGTVVELKHQFGLSYNVHIQSNPKMAERALEVVKEFSPNVALVDRQDGASTYRVPPNEVNAIAPLLTRLQVMLNQGEVEEYGITETSLEDVFLGVTREAGFQYDALTKETEVQELLNNQPLLPVSEEGIQANAERHHAKLRPRPFAALMAKNTALQGRQWGTNLCQVVTPLFVLLIMVILKIVVVTQYGDQIEKKQFVPPVPFVLNASPEMWDQLMNLINRFSHSTPPSTSYLHQRTPWMHGLPPKDFLARWIVGAPVHLDHQEPVVQQQQSKHSMSTRDGFRQCLLFMLFHATENCSSFVGSRGPNWQDGHSGNNSGLLGSLPTFNCRYENMSVAEVPYMLSRSSFQDMQREVFNDFNELNRHTINSVKYWEPLYDLTPDAYVDFQDADPVKGILNYSYAVNNFYLPSYHRRNNFTRLDIGQLSKIEKATNLNLEINVLYGQLQMQNLIENSFWVAATGAKFDQSQPSYWQIAITFPELVTADILQLLNLVGAFLYPVAMNLSIPMFVYLLVMEKENRVKSLMQFHGMSNTAYIASNFLFCLFIYLVLASLFWSMAALMNLSVFVETAVSTFGMFWFLWGLCLISVSFFLSTFVNSKSAATMLGYVVALAGPLFAIVVALGIYEIVDRPMPKAWFIWPQFAMVRGIFLFTKACTQENQCYVPLWELQSSDEMTGVLGMLVLDAVVYFLLFLYLDQVLPRSYGIPKHPLFFLQPLTKLCRRRNNGAYERVNDMDVAMTGMSVDTDVANEIQLVESLSDDDIARNYPLVLSKLSKIYPGASRPAVQSFSLAVTPSQVFGLLGENGAGKTTTIAMLTGLYAPSSGDAYVNGHSIVSDIDGVHSSIGVCPQFSILWDTLTVREHLLFFARLKGVGFLDERKHVDNSLRDYGLLTVADRFAGKLSGGMKRRLCVAMALVGGSRCVFLDEPTTGLDPVSKRQLWRIVSSAKKDRSIILTTHDLFEAEVLSQRIGMMALGELKALGTPLHLKNKFASGSRLVVDFRPDVINVVDVRLRELLAGIRLDLSNSFTSSREYVATPEKLTIAEAFALLSLHAQSIGITAWTIGSLGIESVFERVFAESHHTSVGVRHEPIN